MATTSAALAVAAAPVDARGPGEPVEPQAAAASESSSYIRAQRHRCPASRAISSVVGPVAQAALVAQVEQEVTAELALPEETPAKTSYKRSVQSPGGPVALEVPVATVQAVVVGVVELAMVFTSSRPVAHSRSPPSRTQIAFFRGA